MKEPFIFLCPEVTREYALFLIQWLKDSEVSRYLSDTHDVSAAIEHVINKVNLPFLTHLFSRNGRFFMVLDKHKMPVGFVRLITKGTETEIVVVVGDRGNWGKRLGTSTIRESLKVAFFELRSKKVIAKIHKENMRSQRAFVGAGFKIDHESPMVKTFLLTMEDYLKLIKDRTAVSDGITITEIDRNRLKKLINDELNTGTKPDKSIQDLQRELNRASIIRPHQISQDVVTMNSKAVLGLNEQEIEVSLVYPGDADWAKRKLSVLSPIGTAILGYSEGTQIRWEIPSGVARIYIKRLLYQPEAAGDYHL